MTDDANVLQALTAPLAHAIPTGLALAAVSAARLSPSARAGWRLAQGATVLAAALALATLVAAGFAVGLAGSAGGLTTVQALVLLLVTTIGVVITRFSATYLDGERGQRRFAGWLLATLAGASLVVATDHLLVLLIAWVATSLCLQNLLVFYADRPIAQLAAHKKFLCSRTADLCMLAAVLLIASGPGDLHISAINAGAAAGDGVDGTTATAMVLIAVATLLKSAQLPFHGWLMQVMEAPTPVSALLHAGVVNLGGFVLIRFGAAIGVVPSAQAVLVVVGSVTAVLAALVSTTRVSIKVALAWSTCAQMGFMLLQCGLGLYSMALLHLIGHSIYKAHAFLGASGTAQRARTARMAPVTTTPGIAVRAASIALALGGLLVAVAVLHPEALEQPNTLAMLLVVGLAAGAMPRRQVGQGAANALLLGAARTAGIAAIWLGLHVAIEAAGLAPASAAPLALAWFAAASFAALAIVDLLRTDLASTRAAATLQRWFQEGMHLDGWFTRLTLRIFRWRPSTPAPAAVTHPIRNGDSR